MTGLYQHDGHELLARYGLTVTIPPTAEPVTVSQLEDQLRITVDEDDPIRGSWVSGLLLSIRSAREFIESETAHIAMTQTMRYRAERFPCGPIELPVIPVQSVSSVAYLDANSVSQTLTGTSSLLDSVPPMIFASSAGWPASASYRPDAVTVTFVAGYLNSNFVPARYREAILVLAAYRKEHPVDSAHQLSDLPVGLRGLIQSLSARSYL